jgi:hypothetical protein
MDDGKESVVLATIADALTWRHATENASGPNFERRIQHIIVCPKELTKFETVMTSGNVGLDLEGSHDLEYERIMEECQTT